MRITIQQDALTAELYVSVRAAVGFHCYGIEDVRIALDGGLYSAVAYVDNQVAGIGRVVGDGRIAFFIKDLVVLPQYQGAGVGSALLEALLSRIQANCCVDAYVGLMSTPGKEPFYEAHGFLRRPTKGFGSGLVRFVEPISQNVADSAKAHEIQSPAILHNTFISTYERN